MAHDKRAYLREWNKRDGGARRRAADNKHSQKLRRAVLAAYGNQCACCGESTYEFLAIDHVNGCPGGGKRTSAERGRPLYRKIIKAEFPSDYRILCHNCNLARGFYGKCPHEPKV